MSGSQLFFKEMMIIRSTQNAYELNNDQSQRQFENSSGRKLYT